MERLIDLVIWMARKGFAEKEIKKVASVLQIPRKEAKIKKTGERWIKQLKRTKPRGYTAEKLEKIYNELKDAKQMDSKDVARLLNITRRAAVRLMHLLALKYPHIEEFYEKGQVNIVWRE